MLYASLHLLDEETCYEIFFGGIHIFHMLGNNTIALQYRKRLNTKSQTDQIQNKIH